MRLFYRFFVMLYILIFFSLVGCHLNYKEATEAKEILETIPNVVLVDFKHTIVKGNRVVAVVEAKRGEEYFKKRETKLIDVRFTEFTQEGKVAERGKADSAVYSSKSKNADILGNIEIHSEVEGGEIRAQSLHWDSEKKRLIGNPNEEVILRREDGSFVRGKGFTADLRLKEIEFSKRVEGEYTEKKNEE